MLILVSVTTYTGINTYSSIKVSKFVSQMQLLQSKIDDLVSTMGTEELNNLDIEEVNTQEQKDTINSAYNNGEITTNSMEKYKVFTSEDLLTILDVEDVNDDIIVNFETREILSTKGIDYDGKMYYTQYKLPNGQTVINNGE